MTSVKWPGKIITKCVVCHWWLQHFWDVSIWIICEFGFGIKVLPSEIPHDFLDITRIIAGATHQKAPQFKVNIGVYIMIGTTDERTVFIYYQVIFDWEREWFSDLIGSDLFLFNEFSKNFVIFMCIHVSRSYTFGLWHVILMHYTTFH